MACNPDIFIIFWQNIFLHSPKVKTERTFRLQKIFQLRLPRILFLTINLVADKDSKPKNFFCEKMRKKNEIFFAVYRQAGLCTSCLCG